MKTCLFTLITLCSFGLFAQNTTEFTNIILDGETAYMNVATGEIVSNLPNTTLNKNPVTKPVTKITTHTIDNNIHVVTKGETLYAISKKYGVTIADLQALNTNIDINTISINQELVVPRISEEAINVSTQTKTTSTNTPSNYVVEKGETLYSISRKFNISVNDLKSKNNITTNIISIGQVLKIK